VERVSSHENLPFKADWIRTVEGGIVVLIR
jgi:hypothetical protein